MGQSVSDLRGGQPPGYQQGQVFLMASMLIFQPLVPPLLGFGVGPVSQEASQRDAVVTPETPIM